MARAEAAAKPSSEVAEAEKRAHARIQAQNAVDATQDDGSFEITGTDGRGRPRRCSYGLRGRGGEDLGLFLTFLRVEYVHVASMAWGAPRPRAGDGTGAST